MIKKATKYDIARIVEIEKDSFPDPWEEQLFRGTLDSRDKYFFVDAMGNDIAGYAIFEKVFDEGHITNLAVSKHYRRKGVATRLVNKMLDLAKGMGIKEIFLEVSESNEAARKLYSKFGFAKVSKRKGYYQGTNEDALILHLYI